MGKITIAEILNKINGRLVKGNKNISFSKISTDTRTLKKGEVFVALKGVNFDGNKFIPEAIRKQAQGIICESIYPVNGMKLGLVKFLIQVEDVLKTLQEISGLYRMKFNIPVIGITGSNGKTTTKELTAHILRKKYKVLYNKGNFNNQIGLPITLWQLKKSHQVAVLEMGTNHLGEISRLAEIGRPNIGVITGVGRTHLEGLLTQENVLKAKMELIEALPPDGVAIINVDDTYLESVLNNIKTKVITFGIKNQAQISASHIEVSPAKGITRFNLHYDEKSYGVKLNLIGLGNVYNALAAASIAYCLKIDLADVIRALTRFRPIAGRLQILHSGKITLIDDTYNANPDSMAMALNILGEIHCRGRKVAVLGDMLELGDIAKSAHQELAKKVSQNRVNLLYTIGNLSRITALEAKKLGMADTKIFSFGEQEKEALIKHLRANLEPGDCVLLKASHKIGLENIVNKIAR